MDFIHHVEQQSSNVIKIQMDYRLGFEQKFLLISDVHFDNPDCDRKLLKKHLDKAVDMGAGILFNGDVFDCMESRNDPRRMGKIMPKNQGMYYLDNIVEDAAEFFAPYAQNIIGIGEGNHERAIVKSNQTNLTERLCGLLTYQTGHKVYNMHYGGFIRFMFHQTTKGGFRGGRQSINMAYFHGSGGGGLMTKGVNKHMQRLTFMPDADIHWMGHTHDEYVVSHQRVRLSQQGKIYQDECLLVNTSTYKDSYKIGKHGWEVEKGMPPKKKGGLFLSFNYNPDNYKDKKLIKTQVLRA
jgi:predicted phosphodiesterase